MITGSAVLIFFIVLKDKEIFPADNHQPCMAGYFISYFRFCEDITEKMTLMVIFNKYE